MNAVEVTNLRKSYDGLEAVRGISFDLRAGEVFGLLGPNGAGKTTTVEILEGYREPDAGEVTVLGADPRTAGAAWRQRIDLGIALVGDPELLFLDEPTTGFDPGARRAAWETIRSLRALGKTILLTTHYIEEAQRLADRVAVLRKGEIVAAGTPAELTAAAPASRISFRRDGEEVVIETEDPVRALHDLTEEALRDGLRLDALEVHRPTLEDVYLSLTEDEPE